jgi:hypothetical protein
VNVHRPILGFDTSVINAIHQDGASAEPLLAGLSAGYAIRLNGITLDEIIAHSTVAERERLRKLCRKLLANGEGDVLLPYHEITKRLAVAFESGRPFGWTSVDVRSSVYSDFLREKEMHDVFKEHTDYENFSSEQRVSAAETAEQFEDVFLVTRPEFRKIREGGQVGKWPKSASELALRLQKPGGEYWNYAAVLYKKATGVAVDKEKIKRFVAACPPFRALLAAIVVVLYERAVCEKVKTKRAGKNDVFMATYLPYCDEFISNDHPQQIALRQIVDIAELQTSVSWYKEFSARFSVGLLPAVVRSHKS